LIIKFHINSLGSATSLNIGEQSELNMLGRVSVEILLRATELKRCLQLMANYHNLTLLIFPISLSYVSHHSKDNFCYWPSLFQKV